MTPPPEDIKKKLEELCIEIAAHADLGYEVTLSGNGTNCSEAYNVALAILDILHGDGRKWMTKNHKRVTAAVRELEEE